MVGAEKKGYTFYQGIIYDYNSKYNPVNLEVRGIESVKKRAKLINKASVLFVVCYLRLLRMKPTGVSVENMFKITTAIYNLVDMNSVSDDCGPLFKFSVA